ncbi:hypothetical protein [Piscinibacter gummiphilus]|uniref:Uncharacterized protein n=1 Tax=Piscinibacter gummiphilus TaxID=946333 RepID=A0ABZ0D2E6_9BURK|nr:hypothetical protein [Piscinibacter gummiphilus]WOB11363.1 hypothetical protein RXV79_27625 [Piscinibacter gummiphilus]
MKVYVLGIAQGVQRTHWFEPLDGDSGPYGLIGPNATKRPSYLALANIIKHVGTRPRYYGWTLLNDKHYAFVFAGPQGMVMIAWAQPGSPDTVQLGAAMNVIDPQTGASRSVEAVQLTNSPLIIKPSQDVPAWAASAWANASKPFPWGGDYSDATSVSLTASADRGLHAGVASVRLVAGEPARDASLSAVQAFTVDPNFLSYTTRPIRITAEVRRNGSAGAGFNLKYESTTGTKGIGWNAVPAGDAWSTMSWVLNDAQFVGKWGYHFTFDSDSTQYSGYSIRSVTVTKL